MVLSFSEDRRRGVSTARRELAGKDSARHGYVATDYTTFQVAMRQVDVRRDDVFVDFGSGKGRTLILAADFPFRRIIGVEFDGNLNDLALKNLQRALTAERLNDIDLIVADATAWRIPDEATVLFFFNPFRGEVLAKVCENIRRSLAEAPRKLTIVYVRPEQFFEKEIAWDGWLTRKLEVPCLEGKVAIYESNALAVSERRMHAEAGT
ncbi:MAG: class I SAM-dependent methyltransferase [Chthoniobacteraceae bacterium]